MVIALPVTRLIQRSHILLSAVNKGFSLSAPMHVREINFRNNVYCLSSFVLESVCILGEQ